jgi:hypothetical protein
LAPGTYHDCSPGQDRNGINARDGNDRAQTDRSDRHGATEVAGHDIVRPGIERLKFSSGGTCECASSKQKEDDSKSGMTRITLHFF